MLLVIPSITIKNGLCTGKIIYPGISSLLPSYDKPEDRARLLRKENAKAIHLIFKDSKEWDTNILAIIENVRQAVDIPIEISLSTIPADRAYLKQIIESGIYRLFLPAEADDYFVSACVNDFSRQKIALSIPIEKATHELLERLQTDGVARVCITLPKDTNSLPITNLESISKIGIELGLRFSLLFGVHSYEELIELRDLNSGFDSVILGSALEENVFPCQGIWREFEAKAYAVNGEEANLWENPLAQVPHL
jgi:phosphoribosylformimino-5-aminoimidazole carboxamide ribotide isomerase